MSAVATIGHNHPPAPIELAREAVADLSKFLTDTPVIQDGKTAQAGSLLVERYRKTLADLEDARKAETGPLNEQVKNINERYRAVRSPIESVLNELRYRLTDYAAREEAKRIQEAEEARKAAELAEAEARLAEQREREAKESATFGEITDVAERVIEADAAFSRFQKAERAAAIAERDTTVRLASQLGGRALSMRSKETLVLESYSRAIKAIGKHEKIEAAILSAARDYRKQNGVLPDGVVAAIVRAI